MKKFYSTGIFILCASVLFGQRYQVTLQTPNYTSGLAYLTYYYGKNINIEDSAVINNKGVAVFANNRKLLPGIYSIIFPGKSKLVDFFVDKEQVIFIKADTTDLLKTVVTGSKENTLFQVYQKFVAVKGRQLQSELQAYNNSTNRADSVLHEAKYNQFDKELRLYREGIIKTAPQSMLALLFKSMQEPIVPIAKPLTRQDSLNNYNFYKKHFWDGITFTDDRIIRTPFLCPKFKNISGKLWCRPLIP